MENKFQTDQPASADAFCKMSFFEKQKMSVEELSKYYAELRKHEYNTGKKLTGIQLRKRIHFLVSMILKADQLFAKEKIVILNNLSSNTGKTPKIYACAHIGGNDIQRAFQVAKLPVYLMLGDPGILYKQLIYQGLKMNGLIPLDNDNRIDRNIAYKRSVELLQNGGNLLIFPEGAWSVSPNLLLMKIFTGTVRMAQETGAEIIPMAVEQYGNTFYFNIGKNYTIPKNSPKSANELTDDLRDKLVTLKWDILETQPQLKRAEIPENYLQRFQDEILKRCNYDAGITLQDIERERFHDKNVISPQEAFAHLEDLIPCRENAFLMRNG